MLTIAFSFKMMSQNSSFFLLESFGPKCFFPNNKSVIIFMEVSTNLVCMFVGFPSYTKHTPCIVNLKHASYAQLIICMIPMILEISNDPFFANDAFNFVLKCANLQESLQKWTCKQLSWKIKTNYLAIFKNIVHQRWNFFIWTMFGSIHV